VVFLDWLSYLSANYEEDMLRNHGLKGKLRCQSRVQSYHVLDSLEFRGVGERSTRTLGGALGAPDIDDVFSDIAHVADALAKDPQLFEGLNTDLGAALPTSDIQATDMQLRGDQLQTKISVDQVDLDKEEGVLDGAQGQDGPHDLMNKRQDR